MRLLRLSHVVDLGGEGRIEYRDGRLLCRCRWATARDGQAGFPGRRERVFRNPRGAGNALPSFFGREVGEDLRLARRVVESVARFTKKSARGLQ